MKHVRRFLIVLLLCFLAVFYIQNRQIVEHVFRLELDLVFFKIGPTGIYNAGVMGISFLLGAAVFSLLGLFRGGSNRSRRARDARAVRDLEEKVEELGKKLLDEKAERPGEDAPDDGREMFRPARQQ